MLELFLLFYLGYRNSIKAKAKGLNGLAWAFATGFSFLLSYFLGVVIVLVFFLKNKINLETASGNAQYNDIATQLTDEFKSNPVLLLTIYGFGFGGYLFVRYVLDQKPGKDSGNVHWMDKLNNNSENN